MSNEETRKPWQRRPGESSVSHAKFTEYKLMGPSRSLDKLEARDGAGRATGRTREWSRRWDWNERAKSWDDHVRALRDRIFLDEAVKWEKRKIQALESNWDVAQKWRQKLAKMLAFPVIRQRTEENGKVTVIEPARWSFQSAALITKMIAELEAATLTAVSGDPADFDDEQARKFVDRSIDLDVSDLDAS